MSKCVCCGRGLVGDGRCYICNPPGTLPSDGRAYVRHLETEVANLRELAQKQRALPELLRQARAAIANVPDKKVFGIGGDGLTHWYLADELLANIDGGLAALDQPAEAGEEQP